MFKTYPGRYRGREATSCISARRPRRASSSTSRTLQRTTRRKLPFGVCQVGKSFRNEITPGNFIFRIREFEQMELEFFCKPGTDLEWFSYWRDLLPRVAARASASRTSTCACATTSRRSCRIYSKATTDFEYLFPFGWGELWGVADRTDYDLTRASEAPPARDLDISRPGARTSSYIPYVIEPSLGADRAALAFLCEAYDEEVMALEKGGDTRVVMHLHPALAPYKCAVLPLQKNKLRREGRRNL